MPRLRPIVAVLLTLVASAAFALPAAADADDTLVPLGAWGGGEEVGPHVESIAATESGAIAVADRKRDRVVVFGYDRVRIAGFAATDPRGIAAVPGGGYVVAERGRARRVDGTGATLATYRAHDPYGVALAGDTVLVADASDGRILRFRLDGTPLVPWEARLHDPRGLAVGPDGTVFAAEHRAWRIRRFDADGEQIGAWRAPDPHGVAVSPGGVVYVGTSHWHRLMRYTASGELLGSLRATHPRGVAVDCRGTVTVAGTATPRLAAYGDPSAPPPPCLAPPSPPPPPPPPPPAAPPPPPPPPPPPVEQPELGRTAAATPVSGEVFVGAGDRRRRLTGRAIIPVETQVDATDGEVELEFETTESGFQRGVFHDGAFTIHQGADRSLVELRLSGAPPEPGAQASRRRKRRRVWGSADGAFRTSGRHGAATVRGTRWLTEDRPAGTFIRVVEGSVLAESFERGDRRVLSAGQSFLARPACASRRVFRIRLRVPVGTEVRSARVRVGDRRVRVLRRARLMAPIDLRGLPKGEVRVRIRIVTATGAVLRDDRSYRTCTGARG